MIMIIKNDNDNDNVNNSSIDIEGIRTVLIIIFIL